MTHHPRAYHLATLAHAGRLWDAYMEQDDSFQDPSTVRARLRFSSPEADKLYRTAPIIIEPSWEDAVTRARALDPRQLEGLLRSVLPDAGEADDEGAEAREGPRPEDRDEP